jgi:transcriptional regulator with XRE-family HTH domain
VRSIEDLRPVDHDTREELRAGLLARRQELGLTQYQVADRLGVCQTVVQRFEKQLQWRMSTLSRWALALDGAVIRYRLVDFPDPWHVHGIHGHEYTCPDGPAEEVERWHRSRAIGDVIGARHAVNHSGRRWVDLNRLADIIGCTEPTLSQWEDDVQDDTRLAVLQRYATATAIAARMPDSHLTVALVVPHDGETDERPREVSDPTNTINP